MKEMTFSLSKKQTQNKPNLETTALYNFQNGLS